MGISEIIERALPLAAVMVPAFVLGFGAIWLAVSNGLAGMHKELGDVRKELHAVAERVARIEGQLDSRPPAG